MWARAARESWRRRESTARAPAHPTVETITYSHSFKKLFIASSDENRVSVLCCPIMLIKLVELVPADRC